MKNPYALLLLVAVTTAYGQIDNPITASSATFATNVSVAGTFTATGNATLNGTDNLAPQQTSSSASSLMTRNLLFPEQVSENSGDLAFPFVYTASGGIANVYMTAGQSAQVTTNTNSYAGGYFPDSVWAHSSYIGSLMPSTKVLDLTLKGVMLSLETNSNYVLRVVAGVGTATRVPPPAGADALSGRGWGVNFFYNGTNRVYQPFWYTTNYNVGPVGIVPSSDQARVYTIRLRHDTNSNIQFWINDGFGSRLSATPTWSTNVTWGSSSFGGRHYAIEAASATNAAPISLARIHYRVAYIKYEP